MDEFDEPNFRPGFCPECGMTTGWLAIKNVWQCDFCNWEGRQPSQESWFSSLKEPCFDLGDKCV